jgi:predicted peptidase
MKKSFLCVRLLFAALVLTACSSPKAQAPPPNRPDVANLSVQNVSIAQHARYTLFLPKNYGSRAGERWPLLIFLHGLGERGTEIWKTATHGPIKFIEQHPDFPFIFASPQCPGEKWPDEMVLGIIDHIAARYAVDTNRIYLTGLSMGGYGVWSLATGHADRFAAVAPIGGGGEMAGIIIAGLLPEKTRPLQNLPFWVFHGGKDPTVPLSESERMVAALKNFGCKEVKLTIYPEAKHDAWTETYNNPELYAWFLRHERKPESHPADSKSR